MMVNSISDRFPVIFGFLGVTVTPEVLNVVHGLDYTLIIQVLLAVFTVVIELLKYKQKRVLKSKK